MQLTPAAHSVRQFGVVWPIGLNQTVADAKIDQHQIDVELELFGFIDHAQRLTRRPADKTADLLRPYFRV